MACPSRSATHSGVLGPVPIQINFPIVIASSAALAVCANPATRTAQRRVLARDDFGLGMWFSVTNVAMDGVAMTPDEQRLCGVDSVVWRPGLPDLDDMSAAFAALDCMAEMLHSPVYGSVIVALVLRYRLFIWTPPQDSMQTLTLRLLGPFALGTSSCPLGVRIGRKGQALLTSVAAHGDAGVGRSNLMTMLWPHHGEDEARNALRQCLHQVRLAMGEGAEGLQARDDRLYLRKGLIEVDLWRFEQLAAQTGVAAMGAAAELYCGDFAEGLNVESDYHDWLWTERERLREAAHGLVLRILASDDVAALESATRLARRLLAADPVHEGCYRALMHLYARAGLGAKAMQVWEDCRQVLRKELNVGPSAETTELYERLRAPLQVTAKFPWPSPQSASAPANSPWLAPVGVAVAHSGTQALDHLLRGWQLFSQYTAEANPRARAAFEAAVAQEPDNAEAIVRVGWTHFFDFISGWSDDYALSFQRAADAARRAIACNPEHASAYLLQGKVLLWQREHDAAIQQLQRGVDLAPGSAYAHFHLADATMWSGQYDEAQRHVRRALQIDANDHGIFLTIEGKIRFLVGDLVAARGTLTRAITRNPSYSWSLSALAAVHVESGELAQAREAALRARQLNRRLSLDFARRVFPFRQQDQCQRLVQDWRRAGMPRHEVKPSQ